MISLKFIGKCQDCTKAELELNDLGIFDFGNKELSRDIWRVRCVHEEVCEMWAKRLLEEKTHNS